jgi:hypothetical protein
MQSFRSFTGDWRRPFWVLLLVAASVIFSFALACAVPFAGLCAVAACTLPRRDALAVAAGAWAANQVIGFAFLHYPWTANCVAWGVAIGLSALLCTLAARWARWRLVRSHSLVSGVVAFAAAFATFEAGLAGSSLLLGGTESFTPSVLVGVLGINATAWVVFSVLAWGGSFLGIARPSLPLAQLRDEAALG